MAGVQQIDGLSAANINSKSSTHKKKLTEEELRKKEIITPEDVLNLDNITKGFKENNFVI